MVLNVTLSNRPNERTVFGNAVFHGTFVAPSYLRKDSAV